MDGATALLLAVSAAVALAVWLVPASVHVVGFESGSPIRIAFLPSLIWLAVSVGAVTLLALATIRWRGDQRHELARLCAPLTLLFLWALPYLPWLPDRIPLLLVLAGPARWIVLGVSLLGCLVAGLTAARVEALERIAVPGSRAIFVTTLVLFLALGAYVKSQLGLGGDEPHYLVIAHSLLADGDLQIENNHVARDYQAFWPGPLPPHFLRRGIDGVVYSIHSPGLPALLLPFYAVGGHWGAMLFMVVVASLAATAVFTLARRLTNRRVALLTWMAIVLTVPFAPQSWLIFPEMPAALVMAWAAAWLFAPVPTHARAWLWRGAVIGLLPWLHMKYSLLLAGVTLSLLIKQWPRLSHAAALLTPMAVSGVLWFGSFYLMYGTADPTVVYGYGTGAGLELSNVPRGALGLLFDQEFGLLLYSPVYALAAVGCWMLLRQRETRWPAAALAATSLAFVLTIVPYYMWWGGWSVPARFLLPILPLAGPMIALALHRSRTAASRGVAGLLLVASVASFAIVVYDPQQRLLFNDRDGTGRLVEAIQGGMDLTVLLPSFIQADWRSQLPHVIGWLAASALALAFAFGAGSRHASLRRVFWSGTVCLVGFGMAGSLVSGESLVQRQSQGVAQKGRQGALAAFDGDRLHAYSYRHGRTLTAPALFEATTMVEPIVYQAPLEANQPQIQRGRVAGPYALPAGRYIVRVWLDELRRPEGEQDQVWLAYHRGPGVLARSRVNESNPAVMTVTLPVTLDPLWIGASSDEVADAITQVMVEPVDIVPRAGRPVLANVRQAEAIDGTSGRYAIHLDDNVWVEPHGYWIRGGHRSSVYVTPAGASALRVGIRNGAEPGPVDVEVAGHHEELVLDGGELHEIVVRLSGDEVIVPLAVLPTNGFRPTERDPRSPDSRWLGAWVSLSLE